MDTSTDTEHVIAQPMPMEVKNAMAHQLMSFQNAMWKNAQVPAPYHFIFILCLVDHYTVSHDINIKNYQILAWWQMI